MNNLFIECFNKVEDPRINRTKKHLLVDIIAITLFGIMAGAQTFDEIELFGTLHEEWLKKHLTLDNGIPSHDTINRVLSLVDTDTLQECFLEWITKVKDFVKEDVIAIDGKTMKASHQKSRGIKAFHVLSAYSCANGISLGQEMVDGKTNEITVIPELLERLAIEGSTITMDAMGCQKNIADTIVKKNADYILAVKENHRELYEPIVDEFRLNSNPETHIEEICSTHGRIEERKIETLPIETIQNQLDIHEWVGAKTMVRVTYTNHADNTSEARYFISTIDYKEVERIGRSIRSHWQIENNLHWVLDVAFREDSSRIRGENCALNFAWFRKMALSFLAKEDNKMSNRRRMYRNAINPDNIIKGILG